MNIAPDPAVTEALILNTAFVVATSIILIAPLVTFGLALWASSWKDHLRSVFWLILSACTFFAIHYWLEWATSIANQWLALINGYYWLAGL